VEAASDRDLESLAFGDEWRPCSTTVVEDRQMAEDTDMAERRDLAQQTQAGDTAGATSRSVESVAGRRAVVEVT
jgi:hypothetical protein